MDTTEVITNTVLTAVRTQPSPIIIAMALPAMVIITAEIRAGAIIAMAIITRMVGTLIARTQATSTTIGREISME